MAETKTGRGRRRKMNPNGKTAGRWTFLEAHKEEATPCPDQDLGVGVATLHIHLQAAWAPQGAMELQDPTRTSNSLSLTSSREIKAAARGTCLQTKTGQAPPSARGWPCLQTEAGRSGFLVDPHSPLEWIVQEARDPDPCPPRETGNVPCHPPPSPLGKVRLRRRVNQLSQALLQLQAQALTNRATLCPAERSC